jgi:signal transduction histidine kinase
MNEDGSQPGSAAQSLAPASRQISELKESVEANRKAREAAEREVERAQEASRAAVEEMRHFTYAVTHDLRQPLRSILSCSQLLQRKRPDDDDVKELTSFIIDGATEMNGLIENLQRFARVDESLRPTNVRLDLVVQWALMNLQELVRTSLADVSYENLPELLVDESRFVQLFEQLLSNSMKYRGPDPPKIQISAEEDANGYIISVRDNGEGIDEAYHQKVFEPFKRLHGKEIPGAGLGLAISRKIVRAHRGELWLESNGKQGCTFRFSVPV